MSRRALLLANRNAGQGEAAVDKTVQFLKKSGFDLFEESGSQPQQLGELVRQERADLVIIVGGDGTLNAAVDGLVDAGLPLGIVPTGTANDLARTLGIPTDLAEACEVIAHGSLRTIDLGWVNGKHYFNVASLGVSIQIARQLSKKAKSHWGVLAYLLTATRVITGARPFSASIRIDGETVTAKTVQISVGNGRHYGGGLTIAENAVIDDAWLDLYSLEIKHWWQILPLLPALRRGDLRGLPHVRTLRGQEFQIETDRPHHVSTDGELTTQTPAHFRVIPQALNVFVREM